MRSTASTLLLWGMTILLGATQACAETATLRRGLEEANFYPGGYDGVSDNTIFYYSPPAGHAAEPEIYMRSSDGAYGSLRIANQNTNIRNLLRFDLSAMSGQGVEVTSAGTLVLTKSGGLSAGLTYGVFQIAPENAGWQESTNNLLANPTNTNPSYQNKANQGDPTWFYKSIDATLDPYTTTAETDTTSEKWFSQQTTVAKIGSTPEGYANTGGLWNPIDLIDQDPNTVASNYLTMGNMDPIDSGEFPDLILDQIVLEIPKEMVQSWIDDPASNAGMLGKFISPTSFSADLYSSENGQSEYRPTLIFDYSISAGLAGDFNDDGSVTLADYTIWRDQLGANESVLPVGSGDNSGTVDIGDYNLWKSNFGAPGAIGTISVNQIPEPTSAALCLVAMAIAVGYRTSTPQRRVGKRSRK